MVKAGNGDNDEYVTTKLNEMSFHLRIRRLRVGTNPSSA